MKRRWLKWTILVLGILFFVLRDCHKIALAEEMRGDNSILYETDQYKIEFSIDSYWDESKKIIVSIENKSMVTINNWSIAFKIPGEIVEIWNAKVCAKADDLYVIKNVKYNQDILPGDTIVFGFVLEETGEFLFPESFLIPMRIAEVDSSTYTIDIIENYNWSEGYSGNIIITNQSEQEITDWQLEIVFGTEITSIWNGSIVSKEDNIYKIDNSSYNQNIQPGESISIGFLGRKCSDIVITEHRLTEVTTAEVVDNIVSKEVFEGIIPLTENYFISSLYTMEDNIAAYLVQYYDEAGKGCSYIVVNNAVNSEDCYYIEFGYGDAPVITGLRTAYLENVNDDKYRVLYLGGYEYYIKSKSGVYKMNSGEIYKLSEIEQGRLGKISETQYYNPGETLKYSTVLAKEIGYFSCEEKLSNVSSKKYITMDEPLILECNVCGHCAPTAATNMLIYLSLHHPELGVSRDNFIDVFKKFYEEMETSCKGTLGSKVPSAYRTVLKWLGYDSIKNIDVFPYVTWNTAKKYVERGAVHLNLTDSQIYGNHAVLGVGYVSFSHSSGWVSKYFQIVDGGYTDEYRYLNYSLGISNIALIVVELGTLENPYPTPTPTEIKNMN